MCCAHFMGLLGRPYECVGHTWNVWPGAPSRLYFSNYLLNSYSSFKTWMKAGQQQVRVKGRTCS